jgi:hypothetical protein
MHGVSLQCNKIRKNNFLGVRVAERSRCEIETHLVGIAGVAFLSSQIRTKPCASILRDSFYNGMEWYGPDLAYTM